MVHFPNPYKTSGLVCISAEGLLILYSYLQSNFDWIDQQYRKEVQNTLIAMVRNKDWLGYVEMFDDGEIEEMLAERGDRDLEVPPEGSRFWLEDEPDRDGMTRAATVAQLKDATALIQEMETKMKANDSELLALREEMKKCVEMKNEQKRKRDAFKLGSLMEGDDYRKMDAACRDILCKKVVKAFRKRFPSHKTITKHNTVYFFQEDKPILMALLVEEFMQMD